MSQARVRIVVIEDAVDIALLVEAILRSRHHSVTILANPDEIEDFRDVILWDRVRAAIVDLNLPRLSGHEILAWLRDTHPEIRRVLVTAHPHPPQETIDLADVFIPKPFYPRDLEEAIRG